MSWKDWPKWVKILGVLSLVVIVLLVVWLKITLPKYGSAEGGPLAFMVASWYFFAIVGMWVLGFLTKYLIKKKSYWIANTISFIGLMLFSVLFLVILIGDLFGILAFIIFFAWLVPTIIYFIISLVLISKARKGKIGTLISRKVISLISGEQEKVKSKTEEKIKEFKTGEKPSNWWYLLPILLSVVGGVVGYFLFRNRDRKFAERLLIIGIVIFVVLIIFQIVLGALTYYLIY